MPRTAASTFTQLLSSDPSLQISAEITLQCDTSGPQRGPASQRMDSLSSRRGQHWHKRSAAMLRQRKMLAIVFGLERFEQYVYGNGQIASNWILTSCQPHWVISGQSNSVISKLMHIPKLFSLLICNYTDHLSSQYPKPIEIPKTNRYTTIKQNIHKHHTQITELVP